LLATMAIASAGEGRCWRNGGDGIDSPQILHGKCTLRLTQIAGGGTKHHGWGTQSPSLLTPGLAPVKRLAYRYFVYPL